MGVLCLLMSLALVVAGCEPTAVLVVTRTPRPTRTGTPTPTSTPMPSPLPTATPTVTPTSPPSALYVVQSGDTLLAIAAIYGVRASAIAAANNLEDANFLRLGQELVIPLAGYDPDAQESQTRLRPTPTSHLCSGLDVFGPADAVGQIGRFVCVEFDVATIRDASDAVYLEPPTESGDFQVQIVREWQDCWAEGPEARFEDRRVRVRGTVRENGGTPEISLGECSQIERVPVLRP